MFCKLEAVDGKENRDVDADAVDVDAVDDCRDVLLGTEELGPLET